MDSAAWPLRDRLLYYMSRALERISAGRLRIVRYYFFAQRVSDRPTLAGSATVRLFFADPDDPLVRQALRPEPVISRRFADGAQCLAGEIHGQLGGFIWLQEGGYDEDEVRCRYRWQPEHHAVWDFDVWISPQYRATRLFARLWDFAHHYLRQRGRRWTLSRISAFNPGSIAAHRRIGLVLLGSGTFLVVGKWQLSFFTRAPYVHFSFSGQSAPEVCFDTPDAGPARRAAVIAQPRTR